MIDDWFRRLTYDDIQRIAPLDLGAMPYAIQAQALQVRLVSFFYNITTATTNVTSN